MEVCLVNANHFLQIQLSLINNSNRVTVKDVPAKEFIEAFSKHLKKGNKIKMPDVSSPSLCSLILNYIYQWASYVKTGCYKELPPYDPDWLYVRAASIAYQLYIRGKVGISALRTHYGGK